MVDERMIVLEIEQYYNERIKIPKGRDFSQLDDVMIQKIEKSLGFQMWFLNKAGGDLVNAILKATHDLVQSITNRFK